MLREVLEAARLFDTLFAGDDTTEQREVALATVDEFFPRRKMVSSARPYAQRN